MSEQPPVWAYKATLYLDTLLLILHRTISRMPYLRNIECRMDTIEFPAYPDTGEVPPPIIIQEWGSKPTFRFVGVIASLLDVFFSFVRDSGGQENIKWTREALDPEGNPIMIQAYQTELVGGISQQVKDDKGNPVPKVDDNGEPVMVVKRTVDLEVVSRVAHKFLEYLGDNNEQLFEAIDCALITNDKEKDGVPDLSRIERLPIGKLILVLQRIIVLNFGVDSDLGNVVKGLTSGGGEALKAAHAVTKAANKP